MSKMKIAKVTVVTIMFGNRWKFLSQVVAAVMKDPHVATLIIVDNGSENKTKIEEGTKEYGKRIVILRQEKNLGSAGGFGIGLARARETDCDHVLILDDDCIPEDGAIDMFLDTLKLFRDQKVVLLGNRSNVLANKEYFYKPSLANDGVRGTFFEIFSFRKFFYFFKLLILRNAGGYKRGPFIPIIPIESFIYGGAFLPIEAVREAPLPDASLFLYGDDIEYSWNVKKLGYGTYLCSSPHISDIDFTFGANSSHIFGQFDPQTAPFRVYYRMRNMVRLSIRHSRQNKLVLFISIVVWAFGLLILGLSKQGPTKNFFKKAKLIIQAVYAGYYPNSPMAKELEGSFFSK